MSPMFIRKPVRVEARQWDGTNTDEIVAWGNGALEHSHPDIPCPPGYDSTKGRIWSRQSCTWALPDYWIVLRSGGFTCMNERDFAATYDLVEEEAPDCLVCGDRAIEGHPYCSARCEAHHDDMVAKEPA